MKISRNSSCPCGSGKKYKHCCGTDASSFAESLHEGLLEQWAEAVKAKNVSTIEAANEILHQISAEHNTRPMEEFFGLSPTQMHRVLYHPLGTPELVTFNENWLPKHATALEIFNKLTDGIGEEGIKTTAQGNLPIQLCREILADTPQDLSLRLPRIRTETEFGDLHVLRLIAVMAGLIKKRNGKFSLTLFGKKLIQAKNQSDLFNCLVKTYATKFNWAYRDAYPKSQIIQTGWLFSLYCLSLFGHQWRSCRFYANQFLKAFPMALDEFDERPYSSDKEQFYHCYTLRTLERFAYFWGLIEMRKSQTPGSGYFEFEVRAPQLSEWLQFHA